MSPQALSPSVSRRPRARFWLALLAGGAALLVGGLLLVQYLSRPRVTLDVGGQVWQVRTGAARVQQVLDEAHVLIEPGDSIWPDPTTRLKNGMTIEVHKARLVALEADGTLRHVRTQSDDPLAILAEQQIALGTDDRVRVDGQDYTPDGLRQHEWAVPPRDIRVQRGAAIRISDGSASQVIHTTAFDVARALDGAGIALYLADGITPGLSVPVQEGLTVEITRSQPITVRVDGRELHTRAVGPTVGDALAEVGVAPVGLDYTIPTLEAPLAADLVIRVVRVSEKIRVEQSPIPFSTVFRPDPALKPGEHRVIHEGTPGLRERHSRVRYEDGREADRFLQDEWIVRPPEPRLVSYGPRPRP